eukprot:CAMPEP_0178422088 /NCGR_PEP_ID=MMETSP0689_2-20121128/26991_1 /TAXON_ID=160604 /ORGANISM="Amphidinium massartii, Strain CS-259" /LENGTH=105 /DNA_ID=CAMNT_0020043637 /DNA_START=105 /DNA_END=422 /DNA_ORIENTATION=+
MSDQRVSGEVLDQCADGIPRTYEVAMTEQLLPWKPRSQQVQQQQAGQPACYLRSDSKHQLHRGHLVFAPSVEATRDHRANLYAQASPGGNRQSAKHMGCPKSTHH